MAGRSVLRAGLEMHSGVDADAGRCAVFRTSTSRFALIAMLGAAVSSLALPAFAETIDVNTQAGLASAISEATGVETTIVLTSDITLTSPLPSVPANVTIDAGEFRLSGAQLTKSGPGDLTLSGMNTFGGASITGGTLRFTTEGSLGSPARDIIVDGGSVGSSLGSPSVTTIDRSLLLIGKSSGVDVPATQVNWSGPISGSGQLIKTGLGTLQLTGVNTYAGGTKVSAGTLQVQSDADLGKAGAPVILSGGALAIEVPRGEDDFATSRPISLTDPQSSVLVGNNAGAATLSGPVTGEALNKTGAGKLDSYRRQRLYENQHLRGRGAR